jgi:hypothetical protein
MPYTHNLHHAMPDVINALKIAQRLAKDVGTDGDIQRIDYALRMIAHEEVHFTPLSESAHEELARWGND